MAEEKRRIEFSYPLRVNEEVRQQINLVGQPVRCYAVEGKPRIGEVIGQRWEGDNLLVEIEFDADFSMPRGPGMSIDLRSADQPTQAALKRGLSG